MKRIVLKKSTLSRPPRLRATVKALGLSKVNSSVVVDETNPALWGMVQRALCLLEVSDVKTK